MNDFCDSILTCKESAEFEKTFFNGDAKKEYCAMKRVAKLASEIILDEFNKILADAPKILILSGSGHNGGDALGTGFEILQRLPNSKIDVYFLNKETLKPNTKKFCDELFKSEKVKEICEIFGEYDLVIEGLTGMSLRLPLRKNLEDAILKANQLNAKLKVSIDLPAGMADEASEIIFKSDLCVMTGIAKAPLFYAKNRGVAGRLRYANLDFFDGRKVAEKSLVTSKVLRPIKKLRNVVSDKRSYGHLFVFAGSRNYAGAALMNVKAAIRSGVGLVSAFVPESLAPSFAAAEPAAIWIPCPVTEDGSLALEAFSLFRERAGKESAILAGSGLTNNPETLALISEILKNTNAKIVLDADAISTSVIQSAKENSALITPHCGEFLRVAKSVEEDDLLEFSRSKKIAVLLKSELSKITDGTSFAFNVEGSPVLARAGSGDILAGIAAGLLARIDLNFTPFEAGCAASFIAGKIAEFAYKNCGENAYSSSCAFDYFKEVL